MPYNWTTHAQKFMHFNPRGTMTQWSNKETAKLIEIWGEQAIQEQLEGCKRNHDVYDKISREMQKASYARTGK